VLRASSVLSGGFPMSVRTRRTSGWLLETKSTRLTQGSSIAAGQRRLTVRIPTVLPGRQPLTRAVCSQRSPTADHNDKVTWKRPAWAVLRSGQPLISSV
jgi:hypothetical protein